MASWGSTQLLERCMTWMWCSWWPDQSPVQCVIFNTPAASGVTRDFPSLVQHDLLRKLRRGLGLLLNLYKCLLCKQEDPSLDSRTCVRGQVWGHLCVCNPGMVGGRDGRVTGVYWLPAYPQVLRKTLCRGRRKTDRQNTRSLPVVSYVHTPTYLKKVKRKLRVNQINKWWWLYTQVYLSLSLFLSLLPPPSIPSSSSPSFLSSLSSFSLSSAPLSIDVSAWVLIFLSTFAKYFPIYGSNEHDILVYHLAYLRILILLIFRVLKKSTLRYWWWPKLSVQDQMVNNLVHRLCDSYCNFPTLPQQHNSLPRS